MTADVIGALTALGPRVAGTSSARRASEIVAEFLEAAGIETTLSPFSYDTWVYERAPSIAVVAPERRVLIAAPMPFAPATVGVVEGEVRILRESVVLSGVSFSPVLAVEADSQTVRLLVGPSDPPFPLPPEATDLSPGAIVGRDTGRYIEALVERGRSVRLRVETYGHCTAAVDANVVGVLNGGSEGTIAVTSHYDSVWESPGASDNAAGVAAMVKLARTLQATKIDKRIEFICFGAEELGLVGSRAFVSDAVAQQTLGRYFAVVNLDPGLGSSVELRCSTGPEWLRLQVAAVAEELRIPCTQPEPGGAVDSTPFWERGIPVCCPQFLPSPPWFHLPNDTLDTLNYHQLERVISFAGLLLDRLVIYGLPSSA